MTPSLKSLRYTTALAVSLIAISSVNQANAQCTPSTGGSDIITCTGSIMGETELSQGGALDEINIGVGVSLINNSSRGGAGEALSVENSDSVTINNSGLIERSGNARTFDAIRVNGLTGDLIVNNSTTGIIRNASSANSFTSAAIQL